MDELQTFIERARSKGLSDEDIRQRLLKAGWDVAAIDAELGGTDELVVPRPPSSTRSAASSSKPLAVAENLSPRGFETKILAVTLVASIYVLIWLVNSALYAGDVYSLAFPLTVLLVTGPLALIFFFRLSSYEREHPDFLQDASRRKSVQGIQLFTFLALIGHTIYVLYRITSGEYSRSYDDLYYSYQDPPSIFRDLFSWLVTMVVAGIVFVYYWRQEHRADK